MSRNGSAYHRLLNTTAWRSTRSAALESQPFCVDCAKRGILTPATDVHHIKPVESIKDPETMVRMTYDQRNLACLCHHCHVERHKLMRSHSKEESRKRAKEEAAEFMRRFYVDRGAKNL